jgi:hypothetical protein
MGFLRHATEFSKMKTEGANEIRRALEENLAVPLWPTAGRALDLRRGATYAAAARGDIKTIQLGRLKRVPSAWLKAKLGLDEPGPRT